MKKFSRCALILILAIILGGVGGYVYGINALQPTYTSVSELYIVPGADNEASLRSDDGGLNDDFKEVITNSVVISDAKKTAGTSENITEYLDVYTPADSNIVRIECENPDAGTAKKYVDAVAKSAVKNISKVIPVESVKVLSTGTVQSEPARPQLVYYTAGIAMLVATACLFVELIVVLCIGAFRKKEDNYDDELEYERNYGKYAVISKDDVRVLKEAMTEVAAAKVSANAGVSVSETGKSLENDEVSQESVKQEENVTYKEHVHIKTTEIIIEDEDTEDLADESLEDVAEESEDVTESKVESASKDSKSTKKRATIIGRIKK